MKKSSLALAAVIHLCAVLLAGVPGGCAKGIDRPAVIKENVFNLELEPGFRSVQVTDGRLLFEFTDASLVPQLPDGAIVVGQSGNGYLRRVVGQVTSGTSLDLGTENATLIDAVESGRVRKSFDVTPDFTLVTATSVEEARRIAEEAKELKMIGMVTSISDYVPSGEEQKRRLPHVADIRENLTDDRPVVALSENDVEQFIDELHRLEDNVIELAQLAFLGGQDKVDAKTKELIGDLDDPDNKTAIASLVETLRANPRDAVRNLNAFNASFEPRFRQIALNMTSPAPLSVAMLPRTIAERFVNRDGDRHLVTIYPKQTVWDPLFLERFTTQMQRLDPRITGIPPFPTST